MTKILVSFDAKISNIYIVMKTSLDPNFGLPFQSMSHRAHSWGIPVIQHYLTLINIKGQLWRCFSLWNLNGLCYKEKNAENYIQLS